MEDLSSAEIVAFKQSLEAAELGSVVQPWRPWWLTGEAAQLELGPAGTGLIREIDDVDAERPQSSSDKEGSIAQSAMPPPPATNLPSLSSLTSKPPSPAVALHLLDLLYSYCLVMRLYNGHYGDDVLDAVATLLSASAVIGEPSSAPGEDATSRDALATCIARVCSAQAGRARVPRGVAIGLVQDVSRVLELGRPVVVIALHDLCLLLAAGQKEAKRAGDAELAAELKKAKAKVAFFLSWANEAPAPIYFGLAAQADVLYNEQKATLGGASSENIRTQ